MKKIKKILKEHYFAEPWETKLGLTYYGFCKQLEIAFTIIVIIVALPVIICNIIFFFSK